MDFENRLLAMDRQAFMLAYRIVRDREDARDALQDAYCRALMHRASFDNARSIAPWFMTIVKRVALSRIRSQACESLESVRESLEDVTSAAAVARQERDAVRNALRSVPSRYRRALHLRYFEGYRYREIAEALCIPLGTAQTFVHRGQGALRANLSVMR